MERCCLDLMGLGLHLQPSRWLGMLVGWMSWACLMDSLRPRWKLGASMSYCLYSHLRGHRQVWWILAPLLRRLRPLDVGQLHPEDRQKTEWLGRMLFPAKVLWARLILPDQVESVLAWKVQLVGRSLVELEEDELQESRSESSWTTQL